MPTNIPIVNGQTINLGSSINVGPWRIYADVDGQHLRFQTFQGGTSFIDNATVTVPNTTGWVFSYTDYSGVGNNRRLVLKDPSGNEIMSWITNLTNVNSYSFRGTDPCSSSIPPNYTVFNIIGHGSEESIMSLSGYGVIICFHPNCNINRKLAKDYQIGDHLIGENNQLVKIVDILHLGAPEIFVSFPPDSFELGCPNQEIIVTKGHYIKYQHRYLPAIVWYNKYGKGQLISSRDNLETIHFITDGPDILNFIQCNNLLVDTMGINHPWYRKIKPKFDNVKLPIS